MTPLFANQIVNDLQNTSRLSDHFLLLPTKTVLPARTEAERRRMPYNGSMSTAPRLAAAKHSWGDDFRGCSMLHIDMDAFYASCEIVRHPELKGKPVIIGTGQRSVVSAASYEARAFGVNSAMAVAQARRLCPQGIYLPVDMAYYRSMSRKVFAIFHQVTDQIEQVSVDEGYMDVSAALLQWGDPRKIGAWIRQEVRERVGVTCSVGIASNKLIAKLASTNAKPDGMLLIPVGRQAEFIQMMPVRSIPGIGPSTQKALEKWGIATVKQLSQLSLADLTSALRSPAHARYLYEAARGIGSDQVVVDAPDKSIGAERTFPHDTDSWLAVAGLLRWACDRVATTLRERGLYARTVTVKLRLADLSHISKSLTVAEPMNTASQLYPLALKLLARLLSMGQPAAGKEARLPQQIRLAGIGTSHFSDAEHASYQQSFDDLLGPDDGSGIEDAGGNRSGNGRRAEQGGSKAKHEKVESALDRIRRKYGKDSASFGLG